MLLMSVSTDEGLRRATLWIFGDLSMSDWTRIPYGLAFVLAGIALSATRAKALNALILGDDFAHSLGFSPQRERFILFLSVGLMTAASVSLGGMIGFIGLLIPHIMRFFLGADSRMLILASALGGGSLLCVADLLSRSLLPPMELPAGVVTAIIGAPYFLFLLRRKNVLTRLSSAYWNWNRSCYSYDGRKPFISDLSFSAGRGRLHRAAGRERFGQVHDPEAGSRHPEACLGRRPALGQGPALAQQPGPRQADQLSSADARHHRSVLGHRTGRAWGSIPTTSRRP